MGATVRNKLKYVIFNEDIDFESIIESKGEKAGLSTSEINELIHYYNNLPIAEEDGYILAKVFDPLQGGYIDSWEIISCRTENYDISLINDNLLREYLEYQKD